MAAMATRRPGRPVDPLLHGRRCEQILAAASAMFARQGFPDADLESLAAELGIGKGTLYRYFPSKEALFLATVDRSVRLAREHLRAAVKGLPDNLEKVTVAMKAYLGFYGQNPDLIELLILERAEFHQQRVSTIFLDRDRHLMPWRRLFRRLIRDGEVRDLGVERLLSCISHLLWGALMTHLLSGRRTPLEAQAATSIEILLHGILAPQPAARPAC
jgi:AcrR family transcriptional regulator